MLHITRDQCCTVGQGDTHNQQISTANLEYRKIKRPFPPTGRAHPVAHPAPPRATGSPPAVLPSVRPARPPGRPPATRRPLSAPRKPQVQSRRLRPWGDSSNVTRRPAAGRPYLFESNRARPYSTRRLRQIVKQYARAAGITKRVYPHLFRHQLMTYLTKHGLISPKQIRIPKAFFALAPEDRRALLRLLAPWPLAGYWAALEGGHACKVALYCLYSAATTEPVPA
jgi:hypothetical protein